MKYGVLGLTALTLLGCASAGLSNGTTPVAAEDTCGAAQYADVVGQAETAVEALGIEGPVRIVPENGAMTMDYLADRINFEIGADGTVTRIFCG